MAAASPGRPHLSPTARPAAQGDLLVFNDTQVVKARLFGEKASGGQLELLIERVLQGHEVAAHMKVSKKPCPEPACTCAAANMGGGFNAILLGRWPDRTARCSTWPCRPTRGDTPWQLMDQHGHVPLPPYIERQRHGPATPTRPRTSERYQTVFARQPGAVAAPTAALHFDAGQCWPRLQATGVQHANVTLHVGAGTFQPVKTENIAEHQMHSERYNIPLATLAALERCRPRRGAACWPWAPPACARWNPGPPAANHGRYQHLHHPGLPIPGMVDLLLTNFHLPKSTLMMLVSASCRRTGTSRWRSTSM